MHTSEETARHLRHVVGKFHSDYPAIPHTHVTEIVEGLAAELLQEAHFDQFVPLLVERAAREQLAAETGTAQPALARSR